MESIAIRFSDIRLARTLALSMGKFAVSAVLERLSMRLGQVVYFGLIVRMGMEPYAAHNIAGTLTIFAYTIGGGFAVAASTLIGSAFGGKNPNEAAEYRKWSYLQSAAAITLVTALLAVFSPWIGSLFTQDGTVLHLLSIILIIDTVSQPFLASVLEDTSAVQARGDSTFPMIVTIMGIFAGDNAFRAGLFLWYRKKKKAIRELA